MLTAATLLVLLTSLLVTGDKLDPWPQQSNQANQDFWWADEPNPFDNPSQQTTGRSGFTRTISNGNGRTTVSVQSGPGFRGVSSSSCAGAGCGGARNGGGGFNSQSAGSQVQNRISPPGGLYSLPARSPAQQPQRSAVSAASSSSSVRTPQRRPGSVQRFIKPQQRNTGHAASAPAPARRPNNVRTQHSSAASSSNGRQQYSQQRPVASNNGQPARPAPSNNGNYSPPRPSSHRQLPSSNNGNYSPPRASSHIQQQSPQRPAPAANGGYSPQGATSVNTGNFAPSTTHQSSAGYQSGQQGTLGSGSGGNAGAEGPVVRACSASLDCVSRDACDPYTGFLLAPGEGPIPQLDQPTVAFTRCFMSKNGQIGVCCQEPHINDPWTDRPPTNGNGFRNGNGFNGGAAGQQSYNTQQAW